MGRSQGGSSSRTTGHHRGPALSSLGQKLKEGSIHIGSTSTIPVKVTTVITSHSRKTSYSLSDPLSSIIVWPHLIVGPSLYWVSTWSNSTEDFKSALWKRRHFFEVTTGCLQTIRNHPQPWGPGDDQGHLRYAQHVHKQVTHLAHLMGPNGRPIKELQDILASNSFLLKLYDTLPFRLRSKYVRQLAINNINLTEIRGKKHLNLMLNELRIYIYTLETLASTDLPYQSNHAAPEPLGHPSSIYPPPQWGHEGVQAAQTTSALPRVSTNRPSTVTSTTLRVPYAPQNLLPRWTCPLKYHEHHTIQTCSEFYLQSKQAEALPLGGSGGFVGVALPAPYGGRTIRC
jgi:hypothetical protein